MRVLHVVSRLGVGGIERYLVSLLSALKGGDPQCDFLCVGANASRGDALAARADDAGAGIFFCDLLGRPLEATQQVRALIKERGYRIVHSHIGDWSALLFPSTAGTGATLVPSYHNAHAPAHVRRARTIAEECLRVGVAHGARVVSGCSRHAILSHLPRLGPEKVRPVYYGIDVERYRPPTPEERRAAREALRLPRSAPVVAHVGRFVAEKNHAAIVETARVLKDRGRDAIFALAGGGPLEGATREHTSKRGVADQVIFLGQMERPEMLLWAADAFMFPSHTEGLGLALLEAAACGLPVVASRLPVLEEIASEWDFVHLCEPSPAVFADRLGCVLSQRDPTQRATERHARVAEEFSLTASARSWRQLVFDVAHA